MASISISNFNNNSMISNMNLREEELSLVFNKKMTNYDCDHKLALPVSLSGFVWPEGLPDKGAKEFTVVDINGVPWQFVCKLRRTNTGRHPQPEVFGRAWKDFLRQKEVEVGDQLDFYLPPAPPNQLHPPPVFVINVVKRIFRFFPGQYPI